jgi:peptidoglycan hydrolase CwlO-like protein
MLSPRDWEQIKKSILDHVTVTKGELDAEYKRVVDATKEWDKRNSLPTLQAAVDKGMEELGKAKQGFEAFRTTESARLTKWEADLKAKEEKHAAAVKAHKEDLTQLAVDREAIAYTRAAEAKALAAERAKIAKREADVNDLQGALHKRDVDLTARESKVNGIVSKLSADLRV